MCDPAPNVALDGQFTLPNIVALVGGEQAGELATVEHIRQRLLLAWRTQHERRIALDRLVLDRETEEGPSALPSCAPDFLTPAGVVVRQ